ncbi:hypothetical protein ACFWIJ_10130 [Streptomyces sp. NPDC127079]|uniref:hypothetical protein n=1 Tax=Streptomyces sp. NPDC127079 TaxID=3347132 RepID=UPI00365FC17E
MACFENAFGGERDEGRRAVRANWASHGLNRVDGRFAARPLSAHLAGGEQVRVQG